MPSAPGFGDAKASSGPREGTTRLQKCHICGCIPNKIFDEEHWKSRFVNLQRTWPLTSHGEMSLHFDES